MNPSEQCLRCTKLRTLRLRLPAAIRFSLAVMAIGYATDAAAQQNRVEGRTIIPKAVLEKLDEHLDVTFAKYGDRVLKLDIFRPKNIPEELPAIVCIHGGGWRKGSKINHRKVAQALAAEGYVTVSIDYRLSDEAIFPAHIHDCKAAVRFLRANASQYGIDPDRIGAIGHSAGGHLAALLATSAGVRELEGDGGNSEFSSAIQAVVPMGGQTDFMSERNRQKSASAEIWQQFMGGSQDEVPEAYRMASPLSHLDRNDPPVWLITGEKDDPSTRAESLRKKMDELGIPNGLTIIKNAPHPFTVQQVWFDQMMSAATAFFDRTLKNSK